MLTLDHPSVFCSRCREVFARYPVTESHGTGVEFKHHACRSDLLAAVEHGCPLCCRILDSLECTPLDIVLWRQSITTNVTWFAARQDHVKKDGIPFQHLTVWIRGSGGLRYENLDLISHDGCSGKQLTDAETRPSRLSRDTASLIPHFWLQKCDNDHDCLARDQLAPFLPPRLLFIGNGKLQLKETSGLQATSQPLAYATLSHCWGKSMRPICLTADNYTSFRNAIAWSDLPLTFRQAIDVCSQLGIGCIWIDSMCIIQTGAGSQTDWNLHVKEMRNIYKNAYVNIAASAASNSSEGLFRTVEPRYRMTMRIGDHPMELITLMGDVPRNWILNSRAWVIQERLLSPRVIHYGHRDVLFECSKTLVSGQYGEVHTGRRVELWPPFDWRAEGRDENQDFALEHWRAIAGSYSRCDITHFRDRLPALAGIAEAFKNRYRRDEYIAGFFRTSLPLDLLWRRYNAEISAIEEYVAPSWSWLAITGGVNWEILMKMRVFDYGVDGLRKKIGPWIVAKILDVKLELVDRSVPFGQLKGGYLRIKGLMLSGFYVPTSEYPCDGLGFLHLKGWKLRSQNTLKDVRALVELDSGRDKGAPGFAVELLVITESPNIATLSRLVILGLVLKACEPEHYWPSSTFQRVGTFSISSGLHDSPGQSEEKRDEDLGREENDGARGLTLHCRDKILQDDDCSDDCGGSREAASLCDCFHSVTFEEREILLV